MTDTTTTTDTTEPDVVEAPRTIHRYRFTGAQPAELSGIAGELVAGYRISDGTPLDPDAVRGSALVEEGDEIEVSVPVVDPLLEALDEDTATATALQALVLGATREQIVALVEHPDADHAAIDSVPVLAAVRDELAETAAAEAAQEPQDGEKAAPLPEDLDPVADAQAPTEAVSGTVEAVADSPVDVAATETTTKPRRSGARGTAKDAEAQPGKEG